MSVLALALKRLALSQQEQDTGQANALSHRDNPGFVPLGHPKACPAGTNPGAAPDWRLEKSGTTGTLGTSGTSGTDREHGTVLAAYLDRLRSRPCSEDFSSERFERLRQGALRFAAEWGAEALRLGWSLDELFKIGEPFANVSLQGAAWFIGEAIVTGVSAAAIALRTASGATQRIYRRSLQ